MTAPGPGDTRYLNYPRHVALKVGQVLSYGANGRPYSVAEVEPRADGKPGCRVRLTAWQDPA